LVSIFALTAEDLTGDKEKETFLSLGFDGYLREPQQANLLQGLLKTVKPRPNVRRSQRLPEPLAA